MRRIASLLVVAALAALVTGCGGHDHKGPVTPLGDALGYFAKDAPFVAAVQTDPGSAQVKQAGSLIGRFPGPVGALLGQRLQALTRFHFVDFKRDVRPLLGAPLVIGLTRPAAGAALSVPLVVALHVAKPAKAKMLLLRQPGFLARGKAHGARIYENNNDERYAAVDGDVLLAATNRDILEQAIGMHRTGNRMRESDFDRDLAGLRPDALARISADPRTMVGVDPRLRPALGVKWLASMRRLGAAVTVGGDGVALDFRLATDKGSVTDADLPLAPKPGPLPLIGGKQDLQLGVREPGRLARLALAVWKAIDPRQLARAEALQPHGVDLIRQLPHHLSGTGVLAFDPITREFAARASIIEPGDVKTGLAALAPALPEMAAALGFRGLGVATPVAGESFYALAKPNGRTVVFGVVGGAIVAATEAKRAAGLASEATHAIAGPPRAAAFTLDARTLAARFLAQRLKGAAALAAPFAVAALRDLTGWATIGRSGLRGHAKLKIVR